MARGALAFKETDVARAIRAARRGGLTEFHVRIAKATGDIMILPGLPETDRVEVKGPDLDAELQKWAEEQGLA